MSKLFCSNHFFNFAKNVELCLVFPYHMMPIIFSAQLQMQSSPYANHFFSCNCLSKKNLHFTCALNPYLLRILSLYILVIHLKPSTLKAPPTTAIVFTLGLFNFFSICFMQNSITSKHKCKLVFFIDHVLVEQTHHHLY